MSCHSNSHVKELALHSLVMYLRDCHSNHMKHLITYLDVALAHTLMVHYNMSLGTWWYLMGRKNLRVSLRTWWYLMGCKNPRVSLGTQYLMGCKNPRVSLGTRYLMGCKNPRVSLGTWWYLMGCKNPRVSLGTRWYLMGCKNPRVSLGTRWYLMGCKNLHVSLGTWWYLMGCKNPHVSLGTHSKYFVSVWHKGDKEMTAEGCTHLCTTVAVLSLTRAWPGLENAVGKTKRPRDVVLNLWLAKARLTWYEVTRASFWFLSNKEMQMHASGNFHNRSYDADWEWKSTSS